MKADIIIPAPYSEVNISDIDTKYISKDKEDEAKEQIIKDQKKLAALQERLYAEGKQSLLIVLQGMDTSGKDGSVKNIFEGCNPQGIYVQAFKRPTEEELAHDFLWRINNKVPSKGMIGIFNRSHYEDVLVGKVEKLAPEEIIEKRYNAINNFEKQLVDHNNTKIIKFFLHISKEEQKERLEERINDPEKQWKFNEGDIPVRAKWHEYMKAYEDALSKCNTKYAPWIIVPSDRKWYRNLILTQTILKTLEDMDPKYPQRDYSSIHID